jgi:hypothetical protein
MLAKAGVGAHERLLESCSNMSTSRDSVSRLTLPGLPRAHLPRDLVNTPGSKSLKCQIAFAQRFEGTPTFILDLPTIYFLYRFAVCHWLSCARGPSRLESCEIWTMMSLIGILSTVISRAKCLRMLDLHHFERPQLLWLFANYESLG